MSPSFAEQCKAYVDAQSTLSKAERGLRPVITISREAGAGGAMVAQMAASLLNAEAERSGSPKWTVYDRNLIEEVIKEEHLPIQLQKFMDEEVRPGLEDAVEELLGLHPSTWTLVEHTTQTILNLALLGHVVLVGRGSALITAKMPHAVRVRLVAPLRMRVEQVEKHQGLDSAMAAQFVKKTDHARSRYIEHYFDANIADPLNYDLTLNTGRFGLPGAARLIVDALCIKCGVEMRPQELSIGEI